MEMEKNGKMEKNGHELKVVKQCRLFHVDIVLETYLDMMTSSFRRRAR